MLKMALVMTVLVSSSVAYALDNSDLIQLNLRISRQQEGQQADMEQLPEPREQARLLQEEYRQDQIWRQQQEQLKQKQYLQEVLLERQRQQDAHKLVEQRELEFLMQRKQSGLFQ
jgi:hypothetical protein